ncbi:MAG: FRG domain-containing protein [Gammaproteobacteria bacterium]|jgi:hypothetical protein
MNQIQGYILQQASQWLQASGQKIEFVTEISQFTHIVSQFFKGGQWIFRGEGELYESPAAPSVLRDNPSLSRNRFPDKTITDQEIAEIEQCQSELQAGSDRYLSAFLPSMHSEDVNWLPLARHFGYRTRLIDVTLSPLVALYFSCCNVSNQSDAYVYAMQGGSFRPVNDRNPPQKSGNDYPPIPIKYLELYDVDVEFRGKGLDDVPYLFEPSIPQERLQAQAGKLVFWRNLEMELSNRLQMVPVKICGNAKENILAQLSAFGVTEEILFPNGRA